jgi:bifunctional lysine-specific demethylase and histidyl-hydroxylase NO66
VFVLQVAGSKRWTIHTPVIDDPLPDQTWDQRKSAVAARATETPLIDTVLQPGDALYLPRGFLHSAVAQGEVSIHLTVGVHPLTAYDLARELITAASSDRELRRSLPLGVDVTDISSITGHLQDAAKRLASVVDGVDQDQLTALARTVGRQQVGANRPAPLAPLRQLAALRELDGRTELQLRPGLRPLVRSGRDRLSMEVNGGTISWPAQTGAAIELALSGKVFRPKDCADLDPEEQLVVARRLLREGIVVPATSGPGRSTDPDRRTG